MFSKFPTTTYIIYFKESHFRVPAGILGKEDLILSY